MVFELVFVSAFSSKFDAVLDYFKISPLNNRRIMGFYQSAVQQAMKMRDDTDKVRRERERERERERAFNHRFFFQRYFIDFRYIVCFTDTTSSDTVTFC